MQLQNPLWAFALKVYSHSEVEQCCLTLQNDYGMSINRLLFAGWLATQHKPINILALKHSAAGQWQNDITHPLRALRYQVRGDHSSEPAFASFYKAMRQAELEAEKIELAYLYILAGECSGAGESTETLMVENLTQLISDKQFPVDVELYDLLASLGRQMSILG
ncbi:TIGR02444 family protein [Neptunomonas antarctica]|uniref:TIGR02444 family protein n=1 Tax=Neptunomonas antarctica TaxID=619304 RepID=A0A1N7MLY0_9GAMM|nr:TIGR02444 family protein [Neptunomonas antarctica]SIS87032.1 TIGR02444 family protein [Neptunomonas antarctica]